MIRQPYLIQRARIVAPLAPETARLSKAVEFEYMGSAEFEFGALPQSFRRIEEQADAWRCRVVDEIKWIDRTPLSVYSALTDEEFAEYVGYLERLRWPEKRGRLYLKESTHFEESYRPYSKWSVTDFWWDIDNDVMFGFHRDFMHRLPHYVAASLAYMNEAKK
jgi:hypothetical protein